MAKYDPLKSNRSSYYNRKPAKLSWYDQRSGDNFGKPYKASKSSFSYKAPKAKNNNTTSGGSPILGYIILAPFFIVFFFFWGVYKIIKFVIYIIKKQRAKKESTPEDD